MAFFPEEPKTKISAIVALNENASGSIGGAGGLISTNFSVQQHHQPPPQDNRQSQALFAHQSALLLSKRANLPMVRDEEDMIILSDGDEEEMESTSRARYHPERKSLVSSSLFNMDSKL